MKKWHTALWPHMTLVLALFIGTLWVLNQLNPRMNFLNNDITDAVLILFCISSLITSASFVWQTCRDEKG